MIKKIEDAFPVEDGNGFQKFKIDETEPDKILQCAEKLGKTRFVVLMSGGKDSVSLAHYLDSIGKLDSVLHVRTNIGVESTTDFVIEICKENNWKLFIYDPTPKFTYVSMVLEHGFPLSGVHNVVMGKLKYHTMRKFLTDQKDDKIALISGVRQNESIRRMGNYQSPIQKDGKMWFVCPFFYKSTVDIWNYFYEHKLKRAPAYDWLHYSGECCCGCYATKEESMLIKIADPKLADFIMWLEEGVSKFGTDKAKKYAKWGGHSSMTDVQTQTTLDGAENLICGAECKPGTLDESELTESEIKKENYCVSEK